MGNSHVKRQVDVPTGDDRDFFDAPVGPPSRPVSMFDSTKFPCPLDAQTRQECVDMLQFFEGPYFPFIVDKESYCSEHDFMRIHKILDNSVSPKTREKQFLDGLATLRAQGGKQEKLKQEADYLDRGFNASAYMAPLVEPPMDERSLLSAKDCRLSLLRSFLVTGTYDLSILAALRRLEKQCRDEKDIADAQDSENEARVWRELENMEERNGANSWHAGENEKQVLALLLELLKLPLALNEIIVNYYGVGQPSLRLRISPSLWTRTPVMYDYGEGRSARQEWFLCMARWRAQQIQGGGFIEWRPPPPDKRLSFFTSATTHASDATTDTTATATTTTDTTAATTTTATAITTTATATAATTTSTTATTTTTTAASTTTTAAATSTTTISSSSSSSSSNVDTTLTVTIKTSDSSAPPPEETVDADIATVTALLSGPSRKTGGYAKMFSLWIQRRFEKVAPNKKYYLPVCICIPLTQFQEDSPFLESLRRMEKEERPKHISLHFSPLTTNQIMEMSDAKVKEECDKMPQDFIRTNDFKVMSTPEANRRMLLTFRNYLRLSLPLTEGHSAFVCNDVLDDAVLEAARCGLPYISIVVSSVHETHGENWCLASESLVDMADGSKKRIDKIRAGDWVASTPCPARVVCTVRSQIGSEIPMVALGELLITPEHPVQYGTGDWCLPKSLARPDLRFVSAVHNLVLASGHVITSAGVRCLTLAHGAPDPVRSHPFWGTEDCVHLLRSQPGWPNVTFSRQ